MKVVTIHAAERHLSRLIDEGTHGQQVVITRGKDPVARLARIESRREGRVFGAMRGRATLDRRFLETLSDEEIAGWER
jgi:antitoxin (DNA-binding transcriptional repressor) of toxin-antitoxin stability system